MISTIGGITRAILDEFGDTVQFILVSFKWLFRRPFRARQLLRQIEFIGVQSLPIIALTGLFTGMVFALQIIDAFRLFNVETVAGATVGLAMTLEIGPVFTALMTTARAGSSMAAEIGSMQVTEQVDALKSMAVSPIQFLVVPRVLAGFLMVPILYGFFLVIGMVGAYFVSVILMDVPAAPFLQKLYHYVDLSDIVQGLIKSAVFGMLLTLVACHRGYRTQGGAQGVGRATTQAVVIGSVTILIVDYFLTAWLLQFFPVF